MEYWIFSWELPAFVDSVKTMMTLLRGPLSRAGSYTSWPSRYMNLWQWSAKTDEWPDPCGCACAHLGVSLKFPSRNILSNSLFFKILLVTGGFSQFPCCLKRLTDTSTSICAFCLPQYIFKTWSHVPYKSPSTSHRVWQRTECSVLCRVEPN